MPNLALRSKGWEDSTKRAQQRGAGAQGCCTCSSEDPGPQVNISPSFPSFRLRGGKERTQSSPPPIQGKELLQTSKSSFYISLSVSFSFLFIFSYKIMSKHPSARGTYSKAHGAFSPSQAQTKHVLMRESHQPCCPGYPTVPAHHSLQLWQMWSTPPGDTAWSAQHRALPGALKYCSFSAAGVCWGRGCFRDCNNQASTSWTPILSKKELRFAFL